MFAIIQKVQVQLWGFSSIAYGICCMILQVLSTDIPKVAVKLDLTSTKQMEIMPNTRKPANYLDIEKS